MSFSPLFILVFSFFILPLNSVRASKTLCIHVELEEQKSSQLAPRAIACIFFPLNLPSVSMPRNVIWPKVVKSANCTFLPDP